MTNWQKVKLRDVILDIAAGPFGSNLKVSCFVESGFPIIDGANLKGFKVTDNITKFVTEEKARSLYRSIARRNDVIVTISGTLGQIAYIPDTSEYEEYLCSQRQFRVSFDISKVDVVYLVYYFHSYEGQNKILQFANQVGVPALFQPLKNFKQIEIPLPPLATQKKIAAVLGALDDKIELNNQINHNLEEQAKALFKSWFVDFEPFGGKMPDDWREGVLGDIATITSGKRPPLREDSPTKITRIPLIGASCVMGFTNNSLYEEKILITGRVGTHGVIQRFSRPCWASDNTLVIKSRYYEFSYQLLCRIDFHNMNRGSTQPLITQTDLKKTPIVIPSKKILCEFENVEGAIMAKHESNIEENQSLSQLRDALLPQLMSGEIDVGDVRV